MILHFIYVMLHTAIHLLTMGVIVIALFNMADKYKHGSKLMLICLAIALLYSMGTMWLYIRDHFFGEKVPGIIGAVIAGVILFKLFLEDYFNGKE